MLRNLLPPVEGLLPKGVDLSDLMLAAVLFLLYLESRDEDYLIILAVMVMSILKPGNGEDQSVSSELF